MDYSKLQRCALALAVLLALGIQFASPGRAAGQTQSGSENATDDTASRVGTCNDARSQMEYFCNKDNAATDTMVGFGTACNNAKNNVKEACEGVVQADVEYKFDDKN